MTKKPSFPPKDTEALLQEVESLCRAYVGKNPETEMWLETCQRFARLDKLAKKIRKAMK